MAYTLKRPGLRDGDFTEAHIAANIIGDQLDLHGILRAEETRRIVDGCYFILNIDAFPRLRLPVPQRKRDRAPAGIRVICVDDQAVHLLERRAWQRCIAENS